MGTTHTVVVDLGFGDAGKGTVVDWLCAREGARPVHAVVRFNGGAQAAHNVVTPGGRHHTFAQFGSGTFTPGVRTHLSRFMMVDPLALAAEADHLRALGVTDALARLTVEGDALLTTPYHRAANRARELARGEARHGSCGMGVGETARYALEHPDAPRVADCLSPARLRSSLTALRTRVLDEFPSAEVPSVEDCVAAYRAFASAVEIVGDSYLRLLLAEGPVVFEGAQGVLLDELHGFHPYTTWSTTTFANALDLLDGAEALRLAVVRKYATRHGPGPFVTEDAALAVPEPHNTAKTWQGAFRRGHFDAVALRYALRACDGADALAVTHADAPDVRLCTAYEDFTELPVHADLTAQESLTASLMTARPVYTGTVSSAEDVAAALRLPLALASYGPTSADKTPHGSALRPPAPARGRASIPPGRPVPGQRPATAR
ncbi:adenylosuccinate synthetase [Actinocorallia sp. A-T 12471]|uniref:adenylosuccinate synthetase n=1 Tax=Actinocorallia sp. A-T 12471 TaxID=3089813 RepID=UPI0029D38EF1|nr:adenylosuccinate synthetase [Actinocorallia sp. A-T 12471]MDX6744737.1 adenylosuccinate synthetase [Actinocorallia sp. A-T 12471]